MDPFDVIFALLLGPWIWLGIALGLGGAWVAWSYLPASVDRASICAVILVAGVVIGAVLGRFGERKRK